MRRIQWACGDLCRTATLRWLPPRRWRVCRYCNGFLSKENVLYETLEQNQLVISVWVIPLVATLARDFPSVAYSLRFIHDGCSSNGNRATCRSYAARAARVNEVPGGNSWSRCVWLVGLLRPSPW